MIPTTKKIELRFDAKRMRLEREFGKYDGAVYLTMKIDQVEQGRREQPQIVACCVPIQSLKRAA